MFDATAAVRRIVDELFNTPNAHLAHELYAADRVYHDPAYPPAAGAAALEQLLRVQRAGMPDIHYTLHDVIAVRIGSRSGGRCAARTRAC